MMTKSIGSALILLIGALGLWLWLRPAGPGPKHVLILSVESLRWDHLGFAGYPRPTSPHIDKLVARGTCFRRAYAQAPWTRPSVASTFTSTYPSTHNAADDEGFGVSPKERGRGFLQNVENTSVMAQLSESFTTLAEVFSSRGYRCFGWSCNPQISQYLGFGQGFKEYESTVDSVVERLLIETYGGKDRIPDQVKVKNLEKARSVADEWFEERVTQMFRQKDRAPTMVFVHFMTTHLPYLPAKKAEKMFATLSDGVAITGVNAGPIQAGEIRLTDADIAYNINLYDATIRETDARVGRILRALEESGLADETLVVLAADHGEEFHDHGKVGHGHTLYEELIRVPLVLAGPGIPAGKSVAVPVQNIDLLPTIAGLLWEEELPGAQGRDLRRLMRGRSAPESRGLVFSEKGRRPGAHCAVIDGTWKLIVDVASEEVALYDLVNDPGEKTNLAEAPEHQGRVGRLATAVSEYIAANLSESAKYDRAPPVNVSDDLIRQMRALGYLK